MELAEVVILPCSNVRVWNCLEDLAEDLCSSLISDCEIGVHSVVDAVVLHMGLEGSFSHLFLYLVMADFDAEPLTEVVAAGSAAVVLESVVAVVVFVYSIAQDIAVPILVYDRVNFHHPYQRISAAPLVEELLLAMTLGAYSALSFSDQVARFLASFALPLACDDLLPPWHVANSSWNHLDQSIVEVAVADDP